MQSGWLNEDLKPTEPEQSEETDPQAAEVSDGAKGVTRRGFLQGGFVAGVAAGIAAGGMLAASHQQAHAQTAGNPFGKDWWPSPWGPADEAGASNRITPAKVLEATRLIRTGRIYALGRIYEFGIPTFGARHISITIPGGPTGGPFGTAKLMYNDEMFSGEIGQVGTQFDGLGHISTIVGGEPVYYNGFKQSEVGGSYGLKKLGVHNVKPFFTRGVLIDALALKGGERLPIGYVITMADVQAAVSRQGIREPGEGDAVLFRTGHGKLWMKDNAEFNKGAPGMGVTVAKWLIERKICLVAHDHWAGEAVPGEDKDRPFEAHQWLINMNGVY
ncbi:MAG: cyclase family protein, partial [Candidatus Rokubacteria bacterium]|nr:cyclase family protein [Candidatus Rokubacteria bacterium]